MDDNLYDDNWESDVLALAAFVPIMRMTTVEEASDLVEAVASRSSDTGFDDLKAAVQRLSGRAREEHMARGGSPSSSPIDLTSPHMARLFEIIDAIHDFGNVKPPNYRDRRWKVIPEPPEDRVERIKHNVLMRRRMAESICPVFPQELMGRYDDPDLQTLRRAAPHFVLHPADEILARIACAKDIMRFLSESRVLTFNGTAVENDALFDWPIDCVSSNDGFDRVDIIFRKDTKLIADSAVLRELVELRIAMNEFFTGQENTSVLDVVIDQCMSVKQNREPSALLSWLTGFRVMIIALQEYFVKEDGGYIEGGEINDCSTLRVHYCDAGVYDGSHVPKRMNDDEVYSPDVTGDIFHRMSEVTFSFVAPNAPNKYGYKVSTVHPDLNPIPWTDYGQTEDTVLVRDGHIVNKHYIRFQTPDDTSTTAMRTMIDNLRDEHDAYRYAVPAALKRAGDWGQVEHCRQKGLIFVTSDALTAMYGAYRGVRVFFVKHHPRVVRNGVKFSFVMSRPKEVSHLGGSPRPIVAQACLTAVAVAMAALASL